MTRIVPFAVFVLVVAATRASADDTFVGKWFNVDDKTRGLTRIEVSKNEKGWTIQAWGAGGGGEIDQGKVALWLLGDSVDDTRMKYGFASWDHGFAETHLTLRLEKHHLVIEDFTIFKDNSGRSNYRSPYKFRKAKQPDAKVADQEILGAARISVDGPSLVEFFRKRTLTPANRERIQALIRQLGDDSFQVRKQASAELAARGIAALPLLQQALKEKDIEIVREAEQCLQIIEEGEGAATAQTNAAARLLAARKPAGAAEVLLDFIAAMDDVDAEEARAALTAVAVPDGKPDPVLVRALTDSSPRRRATAAVALCQPGAAELRPALRKLLHDPEPGVRLQVGFALVNVKEKEAIPVLIDLLALLPREQALSVEDLLFRLAQEKAPSVALGTDDASRRQCSQAWAVWWHDHGKEVDLSQLEHSPRLLGFTLLFFRGLGAATGRVLELDSAMKQRWQIDNLQGPVDAQVLSTDRVLIAEYQGNRVTERNLKGEILWEKAVPLPMGVQRFPNGNTFVVMRKQLLEVNRDGREVFSYNRAAPDIAAGQKLRNGQIALVTTTGTYLRLDAAGKEVKGFPVGRMPIFNGFEALSNNGVLVAHSSSTAKFRGSEVLEYDADGKVVWEARANAIDSVARMSNGNTLVVRCGGEKVEVLDRAGKVVRMWFTLGGGYPIRARCR
jgi:hypothetical protein